MSGGVDAARFRVILGHFCTGVTVVTSMDDEGPAGFACQSFSALSLDPPLVLFCPARISRTWPRIQRAGRFCVNVLAEDQRAVSAAFGRPGGDRFAQVTWTLSPNGAPVIDGVLTWVDCVVETVHPAGDHHVVVGRVTALGPRGDGRPLVFYRGGYAAVDTPEDTRPPRAGEVLDTLLSWSRHTDWL